MVKAMVPVRVCEIIDQAIQMHGALGVSQKTPLARMYTSTRTLRVISAGLIDWIHHLEILGDSALSKLAKTDLRNFGETNSLSGTDDANRRADVVRSSTQLPNNHSRMI
jgi:hypothetical protein